MMAYKTALFDMDGTLLDTLEDLRDSTNHVLREMGYPERSLEEMRRFVGNGAEMQIRRAVPEGTSEENIAKALRAYRAYYQEHCRIKTKVYDGLLDMLGALKAHGVKTAVVSNKPDAAVKKLSEEYFGGRMDYAVGAKEGVRCGGRENRFYLFGGHDEGSAALIQGITLAGVLFDEAALMPRSFVEQASARCSVSGSRLWFNCNPEGPQHWFYREWILRAEERGALYLHFTMEDNPSLSPRIRARYEKAYSGTFYRRFVLGEWTAAKGLIYDFFTPGEYCAGVPEKPWERVRVSVDYGTVNPMSFGLWALRGGVWYRVKEYYYDARKEGRQKTDAEYLEDLRRFTEGETVEKVIVDPSAASFIEAVKRAGYPVSRADNNVADGLRVTADLLKQGKIVICEGCENSLKEIAQYCWEDGGAGRDRPRKEKDHAMDEMRYFAMSVAGRGRGGAIALRAVERRAR